MAGMRTAIFVAAVVALHVVAPSFIRGQNPYGPAAATQPYGEPSPVAPALFRDETSRPLAPSLAPVAATSPADAKERPAVALSRPDARPVVKLSAAPTADAAARPRSGVSSFFGVIGALGIVLGAFLIVVLFLRRGLPKGARLLPTEAVEVLGRLPFPGRQQGHLIRVGNKIALVSFSTGGAETLLEITDPLEVDRLAGLCRSADPHSATTSFRGVVEQFFHDKRAELPRPQRARIDDV
jgi:flagellar biogenesis protein FliO